ncbi:MAG: hypothetical protein H0X39_06015 [Actinobacteria bacterium]|nr:hypothetical protein [Actinomycetota bacterium]
MAPVDAEILDEKRRDDQPRAVVHPAFGSELAHSRVNKWVAGVAGAPGVEGVTCVSARVGALVEIGA